MGLPKWTGSNAQLIASLVGLALLLLWCLMCSDTVSDWVLAILRPDECPAPPTGPTLPLPRK